MLTEFELGWLVGVLEGEGCFDYQTSNSARIRVAMTDEDTILRICLFFQKITGKAYEVKAYQPKSLKEQTRRQEWQQAYAVAAYGKDAVKIMKLIVRHMSVRRRQRIWQVINGYKAKVVRLDVKAIVDGLQKKPAAVIIPIARRI